MRVALYARVSTTNGQSPEMQLVEMTDYANHRGFKVVGQGQAFKLEVTNKLLDRTWRGTVSVDVVHPGQVPESVWHLDGQSEESQQVRIRTCICTAMMDLGQMALLCSRIDTWATRRKFLAND